MPEDMQAVLLGIVYGDDERIIPADRVRAAELLERTSGEGATTSDYGRAPAVTRRGDGTAAAVRCRRSPPLAGSATRLLHRDVAELLA